MSIKRNLFVCFLLILLLLSGCSAQPEDSLAVSDSAAQISSEELEIDLPGNSPKEQFAMLDARGIPVMGQQYERDYQTYIEPFNFSFAFLEDFGPSVSAVASPDVLYSVLSNVEEVHEVPVDDVVSVVSSYFPTDKAHVINELTPLYDPKTDTCMVSDQTKTDAYIGTVLDREENKGILTLTCYWYNKRAGEYRLYGTSRTWIDITDPNKPFYIANRFDRWEVSDWSLTEIDEKILEMSAKAGLLNQAWSAADGIPADALLSYYYLNDPYIEDWDADAIEISLMDLFSGVDIESLRTSPYYGSTVFRGKPGYKTVRNNCTISAKANRLQCEGEICDIDLSCTDTVTGSTWNGTLRVTVGNGWFKFISFTIEGEQ